jgi:hypothetical protein
MVILVFSPYEGFCACENQICSIPGSTPQYTDIEYKMIEHIPSKIDLLNRDCVLATMAGAPDLMILFFI